MVYRPVPKTEYDVNTILASAARTVIASTNTTAVKLPRPQNAMVLILDVTAAATEVGDTLDVKVQTNIDGNWIDVAYFTQVLGNGGAKRHMAKILASTAQAMADMLTALTAGNVRHILGDEWRVNYVVVEANANANSSFTFSVTGIPM